MTCGFLKDHFSCPNIRGNLSKNIIISTKELFSYFLFNFIKFEILFDDVIKTLYLTKYWQTSEKRKFDPLKKKKIKPQNKENETKVISYNMNGSSWKVHSSEECSKYQKNVISSLRLTVWSFHVMGLFLEYFDLWRRMHLCGVPPWCGGRGSCVFLEMVNRKHNVYKGCKLMGLTFVWQK